MKKFITSLFGKYMLIFVGILLLTNVIASAIALVFFSKGQLPFMNGVNIAEEMPHIVVLRMGLMSMVIGTIFIFFATRVVVKPIKDLSDAAKRVAAGDFTVELTAGKKSHDEVGDLIDNFNHMVGELSKNEYLHKDFVSNVSHEFKTPITAIAGYAELLSQPGLSEEKRLEYASVITRQSTRLAKLSADLLRLSELENDHLIIKRETFRLDEQIRDAILLLQNEWEQKEIEMDISLEQVPFTGDKAFLYQVWVNLIGNAIRYTGPAGRIVVTLHQAGSKCKIRIKDNGIGMTEEQTERVFERFYRVEESRTTGGTGLGLPIARRIILLHGGKITVKSEPDNGTEFIVEFEQS